MPRKVAVALLLLVASPLATWASTPVRVGIVLPGSE